jgi:hypothetical protein
MIVRNFVLAMLFITSTSAAATDEELLLRFAKQHTGKFASEIENLPVVVTVRGLEVGAWWDYAEYDAVAGVLSTDTASATLVTITEKCRKSGSFVGRNAFGVKTNVARESCETLSILDSDSGGFKLGTLDCSRFDSLRTLMKEDLVQARCEEANFRKASVRMTPDQYRDMKKRGLLYEVEFSVGSLTEKEVVETRQLQLPATLKTPIEKTLNAIEVRGRFLAIRLMLRDGKTVLAEFKRT